MDMTFPVVVEEDRDEWGLLSIGDWEGISLFDYLFGNLSEEELARLRDPRTAKIYVTEGVVRRGREAVLAVIAHELGHFLLNFYGIKGETNAIEALVERAALFVLGAGPLPEPLADCVRRQNRPPEAFREWAERHLRWFEEAYGPARPMNPQELEQFVHEVHAYIRRHEEWAREAAQQADNPKT